MRKLIYLFLFTVILSGCETNEDTLPTTAPCSENLSDNTVTVNGTKVTFSAHDVYYTSPSSIGDFYEYRVNLPAPYRYLYIRVSADKAPTETRTYYVTESSAAESPDAGFAYLSVMDENGKYYYSGESNDKLYLTVENGVTTIDLCDIDMFHYADYSFGLTGRITYGTPATEACTNLTDNILTIQETKITLGVNAVNYTSPSANGNFHEYKINLSSPYRYLYIRLSSDKAPTEDRTYTVTESSAAESPAAGYAYLSVQGEDGTFYYSGKSNDKIAMSVKNGVVTFDLCDVDMFYYYTYKFGITGRVVYNIATPPTSTPAPCGANLSTNVITADGTTLNITSANIQYTTPYSGANYYEFLVTTTSPSVRLYIRLSADKAPTEDRTYIVSESSAEQSPEAGYAYLAIINKNGIYYSGKSNDKIYLTVKDGITTMDLCDIDMFDYYIYEFGITGRIAYKR